MNELERQYEEYIQGWTEKQEKLKMKESLVVTGCCLVVVAMACWMLFTSS